MPPVRKAAGEPRAGALRRIDAQRAADRGDAVGDVGEAVPARRRRAGSKPRAVVLDAEPTWPSSSLEPDRHRGAGAGVLGGVLQASRQQK